MNTKKQVLPFLCVFALSLLASKPFLDQHGGALDISFSNQTESPKPLSDDEEGWSIIRYKIFFPPKPEKPSEEIIKQEEILAYYGE